MKNQYSRLVKKARKNDEKAIRELYDLTIRKMTFIARKYLREDIDDVLQNSYVKAFKNLNQLKDTEKFDKWLGMIVARNCKNELVKRKDISFTDIEEDDYRFDESIENTYDEFKPDSEASYNELRDTILSILNELKPDQRMCIMMFYYQELSIKEISKALEVNENTVKSRLSLAKKKMAEKITELESRGYKIRSIAPIPLLIWALRQEETHLILTGTGFATSALTGIETSGTALKTAGISMKAKIIAGTVAATGIAGGGYYAYDQSRTIDIAENIHYEVYGANHHGVIEVTDNQIDKNNIDYNQMITGYDYSKNTTLSNGDEVVITVKYNHDYVDEHSLKISNEQKTVKVSDLPERYENGKIDDEFLKKIHKVALETIQDKYPKDYGGYRLRLDDKEVEYDYFHNDINIDYDKNVYYDLIMSYIKQSKKTERNSSDKYIMLLRQSYSDYEEDKKILGGDVHFIYYDYYIVEVNNFYKDNNTSDKEIKDNMSSITVLSQKNITKPSYAKQDFMKSFDQKNYDYIMVKNVIDD